MQADQGSGTTSRATAPADPSDTSAPPQVRMGLLDYVTATSMDEDYAHVAERAQKDPDRKPVRPGVAALVAMGLFGLLAVTAAVQTARNASDVAQGRESLVAQVQRRNAQVDTRRDRIEELRTDVDSLQTRFLEATVRGRALSSRLARLSVRAGTVPVTGPGVKVVVDDAPGATGPQEQVLDEDLQKLVNALWGSGAEAISINGQRLSNLSAIRVAGSAITVNFKSLAPPYTVLAVGNPDTIPGRFVDTTHGQDWLTLQSTYGLQFRMTSEESLRLPAVNQPNLRFATPGTAR